MKRLLYILIFVNLYANPQIPQMQKNIVLNPQNVQQQSADELLMNEIEGVLGKLDNNSKQIKSNIDEMKRLKRFNSDIQRDNSILLDEVHTKCKALKILNNDIAQSICKKVEIEYNKLEESKNFYIKLDDEIILKKYPKIVKDLFSKSKHVEFQIREIEGKYFAQRRGYTIPIQESNKLEENMFIMIREQEKKFYTTAYRNVNEEKWKIIK